MEFIDYYEKPTPTERRIPQSKFQMSAVKADLDKAAKSITQRTAMRDLLRKQRADAEAERVAAVEQLGIFDKVQILLQKTSDYARRQAKERIEAVVSEALNVVFGGKHRFIIDLGLKANQPVAAYWLDDGTTLTQLEKPDYDRGGGKVDIIALALRLAIGEMEGIRGPLFLDEVGKHVSKEYVANVAYFLKEYSAEFDRQIILITHNADLAEIGEISLDVRRGANGESKVRKL